MFTGIVEEQGRVSELTVAEGTARLVVACSGAIRDASVGDSVSVDGCCLTVTELDTGGAQPDGFAADLMAETLRATALGELGVGDPVNLEPALALGDRLGGHLVQGHVDAVGEVVDLADEHGTVTAAVAVPGELGPYLVAKGSVTLQGVSLTVVDTARRDGAAVFRVALIPHTRDVTTLGRLRPGARVNVETDVVAKYVGSLLAGGAETPYRPGR